MGSHNLFEVIPRYFTSNHGQSIPTPNSKNPPITNSMTHRKCIRSRSRARLFRFIVCRVHHVLMLPTNINVRIFGRQRRVKDTSHVMFISGFLRKFFPFSRRLLSHFLPTVERCTILRIFLLRVDRISRQRSPNMR